MFCQERSPQPSQAPSEAERALRALVLRLDSVQRMRIPESNCLLVARDAVRDGIVEHIEWLDAEIERLTKAIRALFDSNDDLDGKRRLPDSVPGLGERTIAILPAFAGLSPRQHESGSSV